MSTEVEMLRKELHDHVMYCESRFTEGASMHAQLLAEQKHCNEKLDRLVENTSTVVEWSQNVKGTARLAAGVQTIGFWLLKWPLVGAGLYTAYKAMIKFLSELDV